MLLRASMLVASALADYHYYDYNSVEGPEKTFPINRIFTPQGPFSLSVATSVSIPLPDIDSTLSLSLPFSWTIGGTTKATSTSTSRSPPPTSFSYEPLQGRPG